MASDKYKTGMNSLYDTWGYEGSYSYWMPEEKPLTKTCTCGTTITYGTSVGLEAHQDYCDLVRKDDQRKEST